MGTHPVTIKQARRDMRWSLWQADSTATHRERYQQIEKVVCRIERAEPKPGPTPLFGTAPWIWG